MDSNQISLAPETPDQGISLLDTGTAPTVNSTVAQQRAGKATISDQGTGAPDQKAVYDGITSGLEDRLRQDASTRAQLEDRTAKASMAQELIKSRGDQGITPEDGHFLQALAVPSGDHLYNPETIWEKKFAEYFTNSAVTSTDNNTFTQAMQHQPAGVLDSLDLTSDLIQKKEIAQKALEGIEQQKSDMGYASAAGDLAETFVPFVQWHQLQNTVSTGPTSPFLEGNNLKEQMDYLYSLPPDRFQRELKSALTDLWSKNSHAAEQFAQAVTSYSTSDQHINNAFSGMDLLSVVPLGAAGKLARGAKALGEAAVTEGTSRTIMKDFVGGLKDVIKAGGKRTIDAGEVFNAAGDVQTGSMVNAMKSILDRIKGADERGLLKNMQKELSTLFNPERIIEGYKGNMGAGALSRIMSALPHSAEQLLGIMTDTPAIATLNEAQIAKGINQVLEKTQKQIPAMSEALLDVRHVPAEGSFANVHTVEISLGNQRGQLFQTEKQAQHYAQLQYKLTKDSYDIQPSGFGYKIKVAKTIDETTPEVLQLAIDTNNTTPKNFSNTFLGWLKSPEDNLSDLNRGNRLIVTHGTQEIHRLMKAAGKDIGKMSKGERTQLRKVMEFNRDYVKPGTTDRGFFYNTLQDFEIGFKDINGSYPTERQAKAYFQYRQLNDIELLINNTNFYREQVREGIESVSVKVGSFDPETKKWTKSPVESFKGKVVDSIPEHDGVNRRIAFVDTSGKVNVSKGNVNSYKQVRDRVTKEGYKIIQVADPKAGIEHVTGSKVSVHYVVVKDARIKPLDFEQIPNHPGGHVVYPQEWYTKQANISRFGDEVSYNGDTSIFAHTSQAEGRQMAKAMEDARKELLAGREGRMSEIVQDHLPYTPDEFKALFKPHGPVAARLDINSPIVVTRAGQRTKDVGDLRKLYPSAIDNTVHPDSLMARIDQKYTAERGLTLDSVVPHDGGELDPIFKLEHSKSLDPLVTLNRSLASISRGKLLNQYKTQAIEHFVEEFHSVLDVPLAELRKDPMGALMNPKWSNTVDLPVKRAAENYRRATLSLLGQQSDVQKSLNWMRSKLLDSVYGQFGTGGVDFVDEHLLSRIKDPTSFIRNVAFHTKLGLFNPVQLFLQAQTLTHLTGVAGPKNALEGLHAAVMMRYAALTTNEDVIRGLAKRATKFGWNEEDFMESHRLMRRSGLYNVGAEVAYTGDVMDPKMFKSTVGKFLDKGTFFFNEGERLVRLTAWNVAYREWRVANPMAKMTNTINNQIMRRYGDLSLNMTHASNAAWQHGITSVPTQFFGYQARLMDQFLGKRLTNTEKARAFSVYSMMYGVPVAMGAPAGVLPWYDDIRTEAMNRGYKIDEGPLALLLDGIPSTMTRVAFGVHENYGERYGPGNLDFIKNLYSGDKTTVDLAFGASGSIVGDLIASADPLWKDVVNVFSDRNDKYPIVPEDFLNIFSNVSSINNASKAWYAFNTGRYMTQNQGYQGDISKTEAILMGTMGLTPVRLHDAFLKMESVHDTKDAQKIAQKQVVMYMRLAFQAKNPEDRKRYFMKAHTAVVAGGFRPDQYGDIFRDAVQLQDFYTSMERSFVDNAPVDQYDARQKALQDKQGN